MPFCTSVPFICLQIRYFLSASSFTISSSSISNFNVLFGPYVASCTAFAISQFRRNPNDVFRTHRHQLQNLCPTFNHAVYRGIQPVRLGQQNCRIWFHPTVYPYSGLSHGAFFCRFLSCSLCNHLILQTTFRREYVFLCFIFFQELLAFLFIRIGFACLNLHEIGLDESPVQPAASFS